ncbi:Uncharacterized ACR, COG1399 [Palleronia salina]|uniref:Uncharacterized ACR, COG1399 n=1 Tax=Palleronia salina TaxID=313368 RepID=A0A1M6ANG2_9RHOB|nr:DUF177 domain-containing protein [Palleronia salina]SHI37937.1 Uncharacterized ACR, COG1399 [Palleronia salina]
MPQTPHDGAKVTSRSLRLARLDRTHPHAFELVPDADTRAALADELDLSALRKLRLTGALHPEGRADWRLEATLGATVVQPCGITLEPVTTRIDRPVARRYIEAFQQQDLPAEQEMPEDDSLEPLPDTLHLDSVLIEELALSIPAFPRAEGAEMGDVGATPPGAEPIRDEDTKPFAGLRDALKGDD